MNTHGGNFQGKTPTKCRLNVTALRKRPAESDEGEVLSNSRWKLRLTDNRGGETELSSCPWAVYIFDKIYTQPVTMPALFFFFFSEKQQTRRNKAFQSWQGGKCKKVIIKSTEKYIFCLFTALSISFYSKNGEICAPFLLERTCSNLVLSPTSILYLEKKQKTLS